MVISSVLCPFFSCFFILMKNIIIRKAKGFICITTKWSNSFFVRLSMSNRRRLSSFSSAELLIFDNPIPHQESVCYKIQWMELTIDNALQVPLIAMSLLDKWALAAPSWLYTASVRLYLIKLKSTWAVATRLGAGPHVHHLMLSPKRMGGNREDLRTTWIQTPCRNPSWRSLTQMMVLLNNHLLDLRVTYWLASGT